MFAHAFTRLRRADCHFERLLPFSCKRRDVCPSCGGRRMAEHALPSSSRCATGAGTSMGPDGALSPALPSRLGSRPRDSEEGRCEQFIDGGCGGKSRDSI
ncbi:MAG TPA: hypothetical protein VKD72_35900 [Gemmataceae bacterium]|nr:hypothetical protein [Gemmataceae bacterium]